MRQLLGQPAFDMTLEFSLTALKENLTFLTEERLAQINAIIVPHGSQILQKNEEAHHQEKERAQQKSRAA